MKDLIGHKYPFLFMIMLTMRVSSSFSGNNCNTLSNGLFPWGVVTNDITKATSPTAASPFSVTFLVHSNKWYTVSYLPLPKSIAQSPEYCYTVCHQLQIEQDQLQHDHRQDISAGELLLDHQFHLWLASSLINFSLIAPLIKVPCNWSKYIQNICKEYILDPLYDSTSTGSPLQLVVL